MLLPASSPDRATIRYELRVLGGRTAIATGESALVSPGNVAAWRVPEGTLQTGHAYQARAFSLDERGTRSDWSGWVLFAIDLIRPQPPTVQSGQYPSGELGAVLGTPGTFDISTPSLDVAAFEWHLMVGPYATVAASGTGPRAASVTTTPPRDGTDVFSVKAIDAAGNVSDTSDYPFQVRPLPNAFAHWAFDETGGTVAADSGNLGLPLTLTGAATFVPGYVNGGNAIRLDGAAAAGSSTPALDLAGSFTVMAWVRLDDASPGLGQQTIALQGDLALAFDPTANAGAGGWCASLSASRVCSDGSLAGPPVPGQWTHVAVRHDAIADLLEIFVMGGSEACGGENADVSSGGTTGNGSTFVIGQSWHGEIDDVFAYRRALAASEICMHALA
jgi:hypothetical protein